MLNIFGLSVETIIGMSNSGAIQQRENTYQHYNVIEDYHSANAGKLILENLVGGFPVEYCNYVELMDRIESAVSNKLLYHQCTI